MRIALPPELDAALLAGADPRSTITHLAGETMGTTWHVQYANRAGQPATAPARVRALVEQRLGEIVAQMSHWEPQSQLSHFNRAPAEAWQTLPRDFAHVMAQGLAIAQASAGAFDPTIGRLVDLWGFGPAGPRPHPTSAELAAARAESGWQRLAFDAPARALRQPGGLALDLSGIAKGHAVDAVADCLGEIGLRHALVEIGGELVGRGMRPDCDPWWVEMEVPDGMTCAPLRIALHGLAIATSGNYRRGLHSIDPRTGTPVRNGITAVSVIDSTALAADAWATALTVLGVEAGFALATERRIAARFLLQEHGRTQERLTPALAAMLETAC